MKIKGEKEVLASDIKAGSQIEIISPDIHIATLSSKSAELDMELTVEKGLGYVPVEVRKFEKLPVGTIALDSLFSPVVKVNFTVENMRVGDRTDYNKLKIEIRTDGSITPSSALHKAGNILKDHFDKVSKIEVLEIASVKASSKGGLVSTASGKEKKVSKKKSK